MGRRRVVTVANELCRLAVMGVEKCASVGHGPLCTRKPTLQPLENRWDWWQQMAQVLWSVKRSRCAGLALLT